MGSEPSSGNQKLCVDDGVQERGETYSKAQQEAGLPDSRVTDQQQLEEVVAAGDMRAGQNHCFILGNTLPITCWTADKSNLSKHGNGIEQAWGKLRPRGLKGAR